jgi:hypothetical protein
MIERQQHPNLEAVEVRIARFEKAHRYWIAKGYSYALLTEAGTATPFMLGQLQLLLKVHARSPKSQIIELATDRDALIRWALTPRPIATKEIN